MDGGPLILFSCLKKSVRLFCSIFLLSKPGSIKFTNHQDLLNSGISPRGREEDLQMLFGCIVEGLWKFPVKSFAIHAGAWSGERAL